MKNNVVLSSLILGISIMGSVFIYKTVTPSVKVPNPTINSSTTKIESGNFQWRDIGVKWSFKYKYFNGGLNYIIGLYNIDINEDIDVSKDFEKLSRVRITFQDTDAFVIADEEVIRISEFNTVFGTTKSKGYSGFIKMSRDTFDLISQISIGF